MAIRWKLEGPRENVLSEETNREEECLKGIFEILAATTLKYGAAIVN
jgi:hypothetical protein